MAAVTLTFAGDSKSLERTFDRVGGGARDMAGDIDAASGKARSFGGALDAAGGAADASESKFMGAADILDGLGGAFGIPTEGATNLMRSFGDLSGGFATLQPLLGGVATALKTQVGGALSFIAAHPVVFTVLAIIAALVLLWQHSETFRDIVKKAFDVVGDAAKKVWDFIKDLPGKLMGVAGSIFDALSWPYKTAFNLIAKLWNNTVGKLEFEIPSWVPMVGGKGFKMPQLPTFHTGGIVPGAHGTQVPVMAMGGERISPAGAGATTVIQLVLDGRVLTEVVHDGLLTKQRRGGTLGFEAA